jgi:hypothetical protein
MAVYKVRFLSPDPYPKGGGAVEKTTAFALY